MPITASKLITASTVAALNALIAAEITADRHPGGQLLVVRTKEYPAKYDLSLRIDSTADQEYTAYRIIEADSAAEMTTKLATEIAASRLPVGDPVAVVANERYQARYFQATATKA